jgi:hypothetical protein
MNSKIFSYYHGAIMGLGSPKAKVMSLGKGLKTTLSLINV